MCDLKEGDPRCDIVATAVGESMDPRVKDGDKVVIFGLLQVFSSLCSASDIRKLIPLNTAQAVRIPSRV